MPAIPEEKLVQAAPDAVRSAAERLIRDPTELQDSLERAWLAWNGRDRAIASANILRVHFKPGVRARLVVEVQLHPFDQDDAPLRQIVYVQVYPDLQLARDRRSSYLRKPSLPSGGPPVFLLEPFQAVGFSIPNGPRLRKLATFFDPVSFAALLRFKKLDEWAEDPALAALQLVRYVPRKRVLLRFRAQRPDLGGMYIKLYGAEEFVIALRNQHSMLQAGREGHLHFRIPSLLGRSRKRRALFLNEIPGEQLTTHFLDGEQALFARVGQALASLHQAPLKARIKWTPGREFKAYKAAAEDLGAALPGLQKPLRQIKKVLRRDLEHAGDFVKAPIHANLFGDQILVEAEGIGIVDWDDLSSGDPNFDLGRLIAHMLFQDGCPSLPESRVLGQIRALLAAYQQRGGSVCPKRLRWNLVCALPLRAKISALRTLQQGWEHDAVQACHLARKILRDGIDEILPT